MAQGTRVRYVVSDRAKAFIQLAAKGLECLRMPDFFHGLHERGKSHALTMGRRLRQVHQERRKATEALARRQGLSPGDPPDLQAKGLVEAGPGSPCCHGSLGSTKWPTRAARVGKLRYGGPGRRCAWRFTRIFRRRFPDLFEAVLAHIGILPRPRQRTHDVALCH
jgi:hypothetical protein